MSLNPYSHPLCMSPIDYLNNIMLQEDTAQFFQALQQFVAGPTDLRSLNEASQALVLLLNRTILVFTSFSLIHV